MKVPAGLRVGVCSHTGHVRNHNEDDYLLGMVPTPAVFVAAVADGMGGLAGGEQASRTALRAFGSAMLDGTASGVLAERVRRGFAAASARVHEEAQAMPALRDMGTTLTALCIADGELVGGHVGDTRLYRLRGGDCEPLTTDHAVREPDNLLLRCVGGDMATVECDVIAIDALPGDRFVLVSDGVWSVVPPIEFAKVAMRGDPQEAAERLVAAALQGGGPDNATAVVVDVVAKSFLGEPEVVELPRDERPAERDLWPRPASLRAPWWPWVVWIAALAMLLRAAWFWSGLPRPDWAW